MKKAKRDKSEIFIKALEESGFYKKKSTRKLARKLNRPIHRTALEAAKLLDSLG